MGSSWNDTLKEELGVKFLPSEKNAPKKRLTRGDVEKKERRQKTRRWTAYSGAQALRRKMQARLERLETTNVGDALLEGDNENSGGSESEDYDFDNDSDSDSDDFSEDDNEEGDDRNLARNRKKPNRSRGSRSKPKTSSKSKTKAKGKGKVSTKVKAKTKDNKSSKKRKIRGLGEVLLDDNVRKLSAASSVSEIDSPDYFSATAPKSRYPIPRLCAVTGLIAPYRDPESNLLYADSRAYDKLKEQPPPWVRATANTPFHEALRIIADDREQRRKQVTTSSQR
mmetsp:Transcript_7683/g.13494  ORF Transcript_7683/g.13494 Transcript_7683/m.13494 type:complete len:282 (+) Transcript_7683:31-876(+)